MVSTASIGKASCAECGYTVEGRFCSNCGAEIAVQHRGLIHHLGHSVTRYPATLGRMFIAPVKTTITLAQDPSYRGHVGFLAISVAVSVLLTAVALSSISEELSRQIGQSPELAGSAWIQWALDFFRAHQSQILTLLTYFDVAMILLANFLVLKIFRPRNSITLAKYFKLSCLAMGFYFAVFAVGQATSIYALGYDPATLQKTMMSSGPERAFEEVASSPASILTVVLSLALLVYHVRVQTRFWGLSMLKVILSLPLVLILYLIIYFVVAAVVGTAGVAAYMWLSPA